jgi:hypothetical protein
MNNESKLNKQEKLAQRRKKYCMRLAEYAANCPASLFIEHMRLSNPVEFQKHFDSRMRGWSQCSQQCTCGVENCQLTNGGNWNDSAIRNLCPVSKIFEYPYAYDYIRMFANIILNKQKEKHTHTK